MRSLVRGGGRHRWVALATGLGVWIASAPWCKADGDICPSCHKPYRSHSNSKRPGPACGTLGYGPPGLHPGFQGFGLGYHPGYGYGGGGRGVGAEGGFPFYGGPGYPHPWPTLQRLPLTGINPFPFYGGPGFPAPGHPNYFGGVGPLAPDQPVIQIEPEPGEADYAHGYGCFTGVVPYSEAFLAPFTTRAAAGGSASGVSTDSAPNAPPSAALAPGEVPDEFGAARSLGLATAPDIAGPARGLRVTGVTAGSAAEKVGLRVGDVIRSINGYLTEHPGHLAWVAANAAPDKVLRMRVRAEGAGEDRTVTIRLP
jgi:hypothetical protein